MADTSSPTMSERFLSCAILCLLSLFMVALAVEPSLLLRVVPSCRLHELTGWNCPFCGMTRDAVAISHGHWVLRNPCSLPFFALLFVVYPVISLNCLLRNRKFPTVRVSEKKMFGVLFGMFLINNLGRILW